MIDSLGNLRRPSPAMHHFCIRQVRCLVLRLTTSLVVGFVYQLHLFSDDQRVAYVKGPEDAWGMRALGFKRVQGLVRAEELLCCSEVCLFHEPAAAPCHGIATPRDDNVQFRCCRCCVSSQKRGILATKQSRNTATANLRHMTA